MTANVNANVHANGKHRDMPVYQHLRPLLGDHAEPCLSIYQPTYRQFPDSQQNPVRYKNLLKQLKAAVEHKHRGTDVSALLESFERLAEDGEFWGHPLDGIAVFGAPGFFHVEKVQRRVPELVVVNDHLYIKPLLRIFQSEDTYQILALDREEIRLYQGNRYVLDEIVLAPGVPRTIDQALGPKVSLQGTEGKGTVGTSSGGRGLPAGAAFHGHGSKKDEVRVDVERFFRAIDRAVTQSHSMPSTLPLILAALPEYHSRFQELSHNPCLLGEGIHTNSDAHTKDWLRAEAWRVMEPRYRARLQQLVDIYHAARARGQATDDLTHALEFATDGRVGTLLVEAERRIPGNASGHIPHRTDGNEPGESDLLDDLAERVMKTGGQVIVVPQDDMPTATGLAAVFRY